MIELWDWNARGEHPGAQQRNTRPVLQQSKTAHIQHVAPLTQLGMHRVNSRAEEAPITQLATQSNLSVRRGVDVPRAGGQRRDAVGTRIAEISPVVSGDVIGDRGSAQGFVPPEVAHRTTGIKEDDKTIHSRISIADWDWDADGPEDWEIPTFTPWQRGSEGKGLISPEGQLLTWQINDYGDPHHDDVAAMQSFPYAAKVSIAPSGVAKIPSPDELHLFGMTRAEAEAHLTREGPKQGLRPSNRFEAKVIPHKPFVQPCPTCKGPMTDGYCPQCQWSALNPNIDSDPLSNPPDPTINMTDRGPGPWYSRTIPSHRWGRWFSVVDEW